MYVDDNCRRADTSLQLIELNEVQMSTMRSTALAFKDEYDEVPVSSTEVLEANVAALRDAFSDFKNEVRAAFANMHDEFKSLREKSDRNYERLSTKIDATNQEVAQLGKSVIGTESTLNVLKWIWGGVGGLAGFFFVIATLNKFFHWF
jgi:hypothetical protein